MSGSAPAEENLPPSDEDASSSEPTQFDQPIEKSDQAVELTVVGIGASAGGLEAFEKFFQKVPRQSHLAFVIVQHLDPDHSSLLVEILQRHTSLRVMEAQDQMKVEAGCVYVIPPNHYMSFDEGMLHLFVPDIPRCQRMAIDYLFESMAHEGNEAAIGIIFSGTGTDGTLGAQAIVAEGGLVLVQAPDTAKYDGMPNSAISAGFASHILPVDAMPAVLLSKKRLVTITDPNMHGIDKVLLALRRTTGHDFSQYKKTTIGRRIARRMTAHNIDDRRVYAQYVHKNPLETHALFKELLINVTHFFRDPDAFELLEHEILPKLLADKTESDVVRVWVAGCASGEEAYSIAILLSEFLERTDTHFTVQLYATDLDDEAIQFARAATYPLSIVDEVSPARLQKFFIKEGSRYKIKKSIREMVVFATQNIIKDPPFTRLDLLCCRNVMLYLEPKMQDQLIPMFHYALRPGGVLLLSPSEGIGNHTELFDPIDRKWKFYRSTSAIKPAPKMTVSDTPWKSIEHSRTANDTMKKPETINYELTKRMLLQIFAPASVVTDVNGNILFVHGDTGRYLRPAPGQPSLNVIDMAREGLPLELRIAMKTAVTEGVAILNRQVPLKVGTDFEKINLSVRVLPGPETQSD